MSIENPTLVHFRHFSSLLTNLPSTSVENPLQIHLFYAKQTQFPSILRQKRLFGRKTNPIKANSNPIQSQSNPIQSQFPKGQNERKLCINNGLCQYTPPQPLQKQTQNKPNQTQFKTSNPIWN